MTEQTLNIPQILVFIVVTALAVRWYLSKPANAGTRPAAANRAAPRISPAQIDQVAQMFPQLDRRTIAWDLSRNGGNVAATTEKVLSGRVLETPPVSFQPPTPRAATPARTATPPVKPAQPDLITRYNLASKLGKPADPAPEEQPKPKAWSQDRNERQSNLQKRREEMILAARRKMEEKERAKASGAPA
ncbi:hypothetical protein K458DRAFT_302731 [Lentithecium fluviatile CBS 122367]|uniref:Coupling of ubiquitin conjugation to ER degradation protein 1 n=1 Tax=Lentithecium fluviatile CBS 122367 TaxID=1168545 RepID=A0A6G1J341_9PLEO|nr:hypothetical protein K458DRAFT_302731 [Lentithecium fluviatile CBS 122367]